MAGIMHGRTVDGRANLRDLAQGDESPGNLPVIGRAGRPKTRSCRDFGSGLAEGEGARDVDGAKFLRKTLNPAAIHGKVLVHPDVDAATRRPTLVAAAHDDEELF